MVQLSSTCMSSDFVTSVLHPWWNKSPKTQNNLWYASRRTQRLIDRSEDVFVHCRISCLCDFCGCSYALLNDIYFFQSLLYFTTEGVYFYCSKWLIQSFGVCLQINRDPKTQRLITVFNWDLLVLDWDSWFFSRWVHGLTVTICNKMTEHRHNKSNLFKRIAGYYTCSILSQRKGDSLIIKGPFTFWNSPIWDFGG